MNLHLVCEWLCTSEFHHHHFRLTLKCKFGCRVIWNACSLLCSVFSVHMYLYKWGKTVIVCNIKLISMSMTPRFISFRISFSFFTLIEILLWIVRHSFVWELCLTLYIADFYFCTALTHIIIVARVQEQTGKINKS